MERLELFWILGFWLIKGKILSRFCKRIGFFPPWIILLFWEFSVIFLRWITLYTVYVEPMVIYFGLHFEIYAI